MGRKRGQLEEEIQHIKKVYKLKYYSTVQAYRVALANFYNEYPEEFERFIKLDKYSILRSKFTDISNKTGVPAIYYEAAYRFRFGKSKRRERSKLIREYIEHVWELWRDLETVTRLTAREFCIVKSYARRMAKDILGVVE